MHQYYERYDQERHDHHDGISPEILRRHPELDAQQRAVIGHGAGPLLVVAGPGAGKTVCVELRAVNLLLRREADPRGLVVCTFSRGAARELEQRFIRSARECGGIRHAEEVRIVTIHSLCHRILARSAGRVGLRSGYRLLNEREQERLLRDEFNAVFGPDRDILAARGWRDGDRTSREARRYFDRIAEELIDPRDLVDSRWEFAAALGRCYRRYRRTLLERNAVDFAHLQLWADRVLDDDGIADRFGGGIGHLMVDEYQDTSYVQERVLRRLAEANGNIMVVGDDDQAIYAFRGASAENLVCFPDRFPGCRVITLRVNYRSHCGIVDAYDGWMRQAADWSNPEGGRPFRHDKTIVAHRAEEHPEYPSVIAVRGVDAYDQCQQVATLVRFLLARGVIADYGQVAVLLRSVRDEVSAPYRYALRAAGIPVHCAPAGSGLDPPARSVLLTTIHQAKGREWDVVVVALDDGDGSGDRVGRLLSPFSRERGPMPAERSVAFDEARRNYVAFSRARHLLVLIAGRRLNHRVRAIVTGAPLWPEVDLEALAQQRFTGDRAAPDLVINVDRMEHLGVRWAS